MLIQEEKEDGQNVEIIFQILCISHITLQPIFVYQLFFTCDVIKNQ